MDLTDEASKALAGMKTYDTWQQGFLHIFEYILENQSFIVHTYHSSNREHLEAFLYHEAYELLFGVIEEQAAGMSVREEDKAFIAQVYKYAFVGLILEWVGMGMKEDPSLIIHRLSILLGGNIQEALMKFQTGFPIRQHQPSV